MEEEPSSKKSVTTMQTVTRLDISFPPLVLIELAL